MSLNKVDAKIELIRVKITAELERAKTREKVNDTVDALNRGRAQGLDQALRILTEVEERVR